MVYDTVLKDVKDFYNFFPGITAQQWSCAARCPALCGCYWDECSDPILRFPDTISEDSVLTWFRFFNKQQFSRKFYTSSKRPLANMDMTHSIIVTNLVGERIEEFPSQKKLLEGMRDAIKWTLPLGSCDSQADFLNK